MIIKIAKILTIVSFLNAFGVKENNYNIELNSSSQDGNYIIGDYSDYYEEQYCINKIQLDKARIIDRKYSEVKVGIIDNGVDVRNNVLSNYFDTNLNYEYLNNDHIKCLSDRYDSFDHATHVAGIVNLTSNGNARLVNLKIGNKNGIDPYKISLAINFARENGIRILNISSGTSFYSMEFEGVKNAIQNYDGLIICSAGNKNYNIDKDEVYPASFHCDNIITVGASNSNDDLWYSSNYGKTNVDLFAPGEDIYSTKKNNLIATDTGTSMAAPMVTGVAALLLSNNPSLTTTELKDAILNNVDKIDALEDKCVTGGRLNAYKALMEIHEHKYSYTIVGDYHNSSCICGDTRIEDHTYNKWLYKNNLSHIEACVCNKVGAKTSVHIVKQSSIIGNASICIDCNAKLDLKSDIGMVEVDIVYVTLNGSYKLPSGIIVLKDTDYNLYINGTLSFNYNDDMLLS